MTEQVELPDMAAMAQFGARLAAVLELGDVVALSGGLGAGKTTLARAILAGTGYSGEVPSPTFTLMEFYDPPATQLPVIHADLYRLKSVDEVEELGLTDLRASAAMLVEWPERASGFAGDASRLGIELRHEGEGRIALLQRGANWRGREF